MLEEEEIANLLLMVGKLLLIGWLRRRGRCLFEARDASTSAMSFTQYFCRALSPAPSCQRSNVAYTATHSTHSPKRLHKTAQCIAEGPSRSKL